MPRRSSGLWAINACLVPREIELILVSGSNRRSRPEDVKWGSSSCAEDVPCLSLCNGPDGDPGKRQPGCLAALRRLAASPANPRSAKVDGSGTDETGP